MRRASEPESTSAPSGHSREAAESRDCNETSHQSQSGLVAGSDEARALLCHELRTPLTVITGYTRLLLSEEIGDINDEQRRCLERSIASCARITELVSHLLEAEGSRSELEIRPVESEVVKTIDSVAHFLRPILVEKDLTIRIDAENDLPTARFDPARIEQVLTNLLENAIKFTKNCVAIDVLVSEVEVGGRSMIEIAVVDDGPGIASQDRDPIFEPYVRLSAPEDNDGVGLGLAICRQIVDAHGGMIDVRNEPDRVSRVSFTLTTTCGRHSASD